MRRSEALGVTLLFTALLAVPLAGAVLAPQSARLARTRQEPFPSGAERAALPTRLAEYFDDRLGFRRALVALHNRLHVAISSAPNDAVIVGKNGWLFLRKHSWKYYRAEELFSEEELGVWKSRLVAYRDWLARRGSAFLFVVAPNKESIYEEELPEYMRRAASRRRLDQLIEYLGEDVPLLDLRTSLLAAKGAGPLYARLDSHWNGRGAAVAVERILDRVSQELGTPVPLPSFRLVQNQESGDLASILQLEPWLQEAYAHIVADPRRAVPARNQVDPPSREKHPQLKYSVPIASLPSAVILRDSFGVETVPLLSEAFRETHWYWTRSLLTKQVERSRPDIVIYLIVERALLRPPPDDPFAPKQPARKLRASKPRGQAKKAPLAAMTP